MSLRNQITLRILFVFICTLFLGGGLAILQARKAVEGEVLSSINLALQLVKLSVSTVPDTPSLHNDWVYRLHALQQTRHLHIQLKDPTGHIITITDMKQPGEDVPPAWFVQLVGVDYPNVEHQVITSDGKAFVLIIKANPLDELNEVWQETGAYFMTLSMLVLLSSIGIHLVFSRTLKSINIIVHSLQMIEEGNYDQKLSEFSTQEYDVIADAINHLIEVLHHAQEQNRRLTQHTLDVQEDERKRLSQELHDELGQSLTAIKVMTASIANQHKDTPKIAASISELCDHLMQVVRSMMKQLHPMVLTELGLKATLIDLIEHWHERNTTLSIHLDCDDRVNDLEKNTAIQVYRLVQECLTNINRHAQASHVTIQLAQDKNKHFKLSVIDNGKGCDLEQMSSGFGLLGMKERIKSLGGEFTIQSHPQAGMIISALFPSA